MDDKNWMIVADQQLCLDLPEVQLGDRHHNSALEFARVQQAREGLRELAWALGKHRAAVDLDACRRILTMPPNPD